MSLGTITTIEQLHVAQQQAVALELSTIPPYLCACWTINDATNQVAGLIQSVATVEMRHMAIAANALIATGGSPDVAAAVPSYPTYLPDGEQEFEVGLLPFGPAFLQQAMWIEQPSPAQAVSDRLRALISAGSVIPRRHRLLAMGNTYPTIGEFYAAIITGIQTLVDQLGESAVFPNGGNPN